MNKSKQDEKIIALVILHVFCNNRKMLGGSRVKGGNIVLLSLTLNTVILTVFDIFKIRTVCFMISGSGFQ